MIVYPPRDRGPHRGATQRRMERRVGERLEKLVDTLAKVLLPERRLRHCWRRFVLQSLWAACAARPPEAFVQTRALVYLWAWVRRQKAEAGLEDLLSKCAFASYRSESESEGRRHLLEKPQKPKAVKTLVVEKEVVVKKDEAAVREMREAFEAERQAWTMTTRTERFEIKDKTKRLERASKLLDECRARSERALAASKARLDLANATARQACEERDAMERRNLAAVRRADEARSEVKRLKEELRALKRQRSTVRRSNVTQKDLDAAKSKARLERERREYFELFAAEERHKRHALAARCLALLQDKEDKEDDADEKVVGLLKAATVDDSDDDEVCPREAVVVSSTKLLLGGGFADDDNQDEKSSSSSEDGRWRAIRAGVGAILEAKVHGPPIETQDEAPDLAEACATVEPLNKALADLDEDVTRSHQTRHAKRIALARLALATLGVPPPPADLAATLDVLRVSPERLTKELNVAAENLIIDRPDQNQDRVASPVVEDAATAPVVDRREESPPKPKATAGGPEEEGHQEEEGGGDQQQQVVKEEEADLEESPSPPLQQTGSSSTSSRRSSSSTQTSPRRVRSDSAQTSPEKKPSVVDDAAIRQLRARLADAVRNVRGNAEVVGALSRQREEAEARAKVAEARFRLQALAHVASKPLRRAWRRWRNALVRGKRLAAAVLLRRAAKVRLRGVVDRWRHAIRRASMSFEPASFCGGLDDDGPEDDDDAPHASSSSFSSFPPQPQPQPQQEEEEDEEEEVNVRASASSLRSVPPPPPCYAKKAAQEKKLEGSVAASSSSPADPHRGTSPSSSTTSSPVGGVPLPTTRILESKVETLALQNAHLAKALRAAPRDATVASAEIRVLQARLETTATALLQEREARRLEVGRAEDQLRDARRAFHEERSRTDERIKDDAETINDLTDRALALETQLNNGSAGANKRAADALLQSQHHAADLVLHARRRQRRRGAENNDDGEQRKHHHRGGHPPPPTVARAEPPKATTVHRSQNNVIWEAQERATIADLLHQNDTVVAEVVGPNHYHT